MEWVNRLNSRLGKTGVSRGPKRNGLSRLWPVQIRDHSPLTFSKPRIRNYRKPRPCLIWPKTGSTVSMRNASRWRPRLVCNSRRIRSLGDS